MFMFRDDRGAVKRQQGRVQQRRPIRGTHRAILSSCPASMLRRLVFTESPASGRCESRLLALLVLGSETYSGVDAKRVSCESDDAESSGGGPGAGKQSVDEFMCGRCDEWEGACGRSSQTGRVCACVRACEEGATRTISSWLAHSLSCRCLAAAAERASGSGGRAQQSRREWRWQPLSSRASAGPQCLAPQRVCRGRAWALGLLRCSCRVSDGARGRVPSRGWLYNGRVPRARGETERNSDRDTAIKESKMVDLYRYWLEGLAQQPTAFSCKLVDLKCLVLAHHSRARPRPSTDIPRRKGTSAEPGDPTQPVHMRDHTNTCPRAERLSLAIARFVRLRMRRRVCHRVRPAKFRKRPSRA